MNMCVGDLEEEMSEVKRGLGVKKLKVMQYR